MNNKFVKAIFTVTFFSVITRALGFLLKIYLSRKLGSVLLGSYQVAMSIFAVLLTLVSSGIPVVLSRNVSYYNGQKNEKLIGSIVSSGLILTGAICLFVSTAVLVFPNFLSLFFSSNEASQMILLLLPALVFSSIYEVLRGALWGKQKFFIISFTEFLEQVVRIVLIFLFFETPILCISPTNRTALSLSLACIISSIVVCIIYFKCGGKLFSPRPEFKKLLKSSTPITSVQTISAVVSSIIAIIIPIRLRLFGYTETEALAEFGTIMGMTFPLIMIPSTLTSALAVTIIPSISEQSNDIDSGKIKNKVILQSKVNFAIRASIIFSGFLIGLFMSMGIPICELLFNNSRAGIFLISSALIMIPISFSQITSSILNAIGLELKSLKNYALSASLLIFSILFLPKHIGTFSLVVGYALMSTTQSLLNFAMLKKRKLANFSFAKTLISIILASIISFIFGKFVSKLFTNKILSLVLGSTFALASAGILCIVFNLTNILIILKNKKLKH